MVNVRPKPVKSCPTCGQDFQPTHAKTQKYCSRACIPAPGRKHLVCPCGTNTGSYQRKYCSPEHRAEYSKKKAPVRMVTHTCQSCGSDFERPWYYASKGMFCSIECSNQNHSRYRTQHFEFGQVHLSSGMELRFVACLLRFDVPWAPWPDDDPFVYDDDGTRREYRPDFVVGDMAIEVKGGEPEDHPQRQARSRWDRSETLVLVRRDELAKLEGCGSRGRFLATLESMKPLRKV